MIGKLTDSPANPTPSNTAKTLNSIFSIPYKAYLSQTQTLHQRLGDLRHLKDGTGAYIRSNYSLLYSKQDFNANQSLSMYTDIMLGGDYGISHFRGKSFLGIALNITPIQDFGNDNSYRGDSIAYGFSIYGTTLFENGIYTDWVAKYFLANHEYKLHSNQPINFTSQALLGSFELGYKFRLPIQTPDFDHSFYYLKPQFNLSLGAIFGGHSLSIQHTDDYTIKARYSQSIPIQPSIAIDLGRRFDREKFFGDVFVTLGAQYTFNASNPLNLQTPFNELSLKQDDIFNLKLGVGGNLILSSGIRFYFDLSSMFLGRIAPVLSLNAGVRIPLGILERKPPSLPTSPTLPIIYGF